MQDLRSHAAGAADYVALFAAVVARELAASAVGVGGLAEGVKYHVDGLGAEGEGHGEIPVVGDEDVGPGPHAVDASHLRGLVALAGDEEVDLALPTQQPQPLRHGARGEHVAVDGD